MQPKDDQVWSVYQLNRYIRQYLSEDLTLQSIWVRGELSNFKHHSRGHMYFTLKDETSRINAVMFARANRHLKFLPKDGDKVLVRCTVSMYEIGGQVQLYVKEMQPDGIGNLFLAFEQLKQKLQEEGLFAEERKRALPAHPKTVGVITSPSGAAIRDIVTTIQKRSPYTNILLFPAVVQGDQAASSIVAAVELANAHYKEEADVLIIGRGGGSLEDLWAFNEEAVARAVDQSEIPVISAVGHETDVTIIDFVADWRAATPTAAAQVAVPSAAELKDKVNSLYIRMHAAGRRAVQTCRERLQRLQQSPVMRQPTAHLREYEQRLDYLHMSLCRAAERKVQTEAHTLERLIDRINLSRMRERVATLKRESGRLRDRLAKAVSRLQRDKRTQLALKVRQLDALSPLKVLKRGYSLVYREQDQRLVKSTADVELGDIVHVHVSNGKLDCQVWGMEEKK